MMRATGDGNVRTMTRSERVDKECEVDEDYQSLGKRLIMLTSYLRGSSPNRYARRVLVCCAPISTKVETKLLGKKCNSFHILMLPKRPLEKTAGRLQQNRISSPWSLQI
jgi:hypothetical protein